MLQRPADNLVDGVVASDIFADADRVTLEGEQSGGVQASGSVEC